MTAPSRDLIVTAPNGVTWRRRPGGTSSGAEFLATLATPADSGGRIAREWNWWQDGRQHLEEDQILDVIRQWEHAPPARSAAAARPSPGPCHTGQRGVAAPVRVQLPRHQAGLGAAFRSGSHPVAIRGMKWSASGVVPRVPPQ